MGYIEQFHNQRTLEEDASLGRDLKQKARDNEMINNAITEDRYLNDRNVPLTAIMQQGRGNIAPEQQNAPMAPRDTSMPVQGNNQQMMPPPQGEQDGQIAQQVEQVLDTIEQNPNQADQILQEVQKNPELFQAVITTIQSMQQEMQGQNQEQNQGLPIPTPQNNGY